MVVAFNLKKFKNVGKIIILIRTTYEKEFYKYLEKIQTHLYSINRIVII